MVHKKIRIPRESANEIMHALGSQKNAIEFEDLTKNDLEAKKNFGEMIKRCDESRKKIDDYMRVSYDFHTPIKKYTKFEHFKNDLEKDIANRDKKFGSTYFDLLENEISENDKKINELVDSHSQIRDDLVTLIEKKYVLLKAAELVRNNIAYGDFSESDAGENGVKQSINSNLNFMTGVVSTESELKMKRMIFRISRGRAVTTFYSLDINTDEYLLTSSVSQRGFSFSGTEDNNLKGQKLSSLIESKEVGSINTKKQIFTVIFTGGEEGILLKKILKACEIFQASRYPVPRNSEINNEIQIITKDISEKKNVLISIEKNLNDLLYLSNKFYGKNGVKYPLYKLYFEQQKMIYTTLNKFIIRENFLDGQVWIPRRSLEDIENLLRDIFKGKENKLTAQLTDFENEEEENPPTYIRTNEFTSTFQQIVDTYGIPHYREINPGYFSIITFPFLFGVMFGDICHGLVLFIFGLFLCLNNKNIIKSDSLFKTLSPARYFVLLLGFFAVYCGALYNDFASVPINFKSCYDITGEKYDDLEPIEGCKYEFGIDPAWMSASNELGFINSLKMKLSVILGVSHMVLGIFLKGLNGLFSCNFVEVIFVFIPQITLMLILFGYMDFLIFIKWNINYKKIEYLAPDIKTLLMNIFLQAGKLPDPPTKTDDWKFYASREFLEKLHFYILIASGVCVVVMFIPKVVISYLMAKSKYNKKVMRNVGAIDENNEEEEKINQEQLIQNNVNEIEPPVFSDFFVETVIDTIEFVLGTVSNTASYLRLWALSLAHSQLSVVFFSKSIGSFGSMSGSSMLNGILLGVIFFIFASVTVFVLLLMDLMECALHTLRLHWVEFQNKFYKADGYAFKPFCFEQSLNLNDEEIRQ